MNGGGATTLIEWYLWADEQSWKDGDTPIKLSEGSFKFMLESGYINCITGAGDCNTKLDGRIEVEYNSKEDITGRTIHTIPSGDYNKILLRVDIDKGKRYAKQRGTTYIHTLLKAKTKKKKKKRKSGKRKSGKRKRKSGKSKQRKKRRKTRRT